MHQQTLASVIRQYAKISYGKYHLFVITLINYGRYIMTLIIYFMFYSFSKVYSILMCQLLMTLALVAVAIYHEPTQFYIRTHPWLSIIAMVLSFGILIALACCENVRRKSPMNFILLLVFTLTMSFLIAVTVSRQYPEHVLMALGITVVLCFSLTIFAFQTKIDFTVMGGFLLVAIIVFFIASIVYIFFPGKLFKLIISSIGVILFSLYLLYDTQMMIGGDHKYSISPEEYIFAALTIYIDVVNIFLYILAIISGSTDD